MRALLCGRDVSMVDYAIQRSMRILPLYFFVVIFAGFCTGSWEKVPAAMLFLVGGKEMGSFSHVWWSLAVEVHFYLMVPFLYLLFSRKWMALLLAIFSMYAAFFVAFAGGFFAVTETVRVGVGHSVLGNFNAFLAGALVCYLMERFSFEISRKTAFLMLLVLAVLMLTLLEIRAEKGGRIYADYPAVILGESVLWGAIMAVMLASNVSFFGRVGSVLAKISYSLYLCHLPIIFFFAVHMKFGTTGFPHDPGYAFLLSVFIAFAVSMLLYRTIEVPAFVVRDVVLKKRAAAQRLVA